jgi:uncharacterized membrane protein
MSGTTRLGLGTALVFGAVLQAGPATADVTFEIMGPGIALDVSADGSVVVGHGLGNHETFRWSEATGVVSLGPTADGTPAVSADGTRISATIFGPGESYRTQGLWTLGVGWQELMPPTPPDGGLMDGSYGSPWGISGDGQTLVGLYWLPAVGKAHASRWTQATGLVDLGARTGSSRANDVSYDGRVIVGWDEDPDGAWRAAVWVDGVQTILASNPGFTDAAAVSHDGTVAVGQDRDSVTSTQSEAASWWWNGTTWIRRRLGVLPGTFPGFGSVRGMSITADHRVIVGYNAFDNFNSTGFIWTEDTGMRDVEQFLIGHGIAPPADFDLLTLMAISDDGTTMVGYGRDIFPPYGNRWFRIRLSSPLAVGDEGASVLHLSAFPNPTRGAATIQLDLPQGGEVTLAVHDVAGRLVRRLASGMHPVGRTHVSWDGRDEVGGSVAPGIYYVRCSSGVLQKTAKIVRVR